eukprot:c19222_g1_i1.p1 GENE.c19222_g1_i1~~c19222_g1_i1.p1  ORF type:complete len:150 (-),score=37.14 c19222_g1_i1:908-1357(-)
MYTGILLMALPITIIGANFTELYRQLEEKIRLEIEDKQVRAEALLLIFTKTSNAPKLHAWNRWRDFVRHERKKSDNPETSFKRILEARFEAFEAKIGMRPAEHNSEPDAVLVSRESLRKIVKSVVEIEAAALHEELNAKLDELLVTAPS